MGGPNPKQGVYSGWPGPGTLVATDGGYRIENGVMSVEGGSRIVHVMPGPGGAPTRATTLPEDAEARKRHPVVTGVLDYFPDAIVALAELSYLGNEQHNPGAPLHWDRSKSGDEADTLGRHLLQRGTRDKDGARHSTKVAWRALALLQKEIEGER